MMAAGSTRYLRYILFAAFGIAILYFISTSSLPSYTQPLTSGGKLSWDSPKDEKTSPNPNDISDAFSTPKSSSSNSGSGKTLQDLTPNVSPVTPSELSPPAPGERVNATFVTLARNSDIWEIARSIRQVEDRFNRNYNYDWVFLNDKPFDDQFKKVTTSLVSGKTHYGEIPEEHWSFPPWIDTKKAEAVREDMRRRKIIYGDSVSYRHMCRFESGFFFRHPLMQQFEYYWRVEPSVELFCDIHYDPFRYMKDNKKKYSFVLSLYEYVETIPTLWDSVKKFMKNHPEHIAEDNSLAFLSDDGGETYNKCHFWSNFEIGNLDWLRSQAYIDFFESLDKDGGFFYERWGDAPVHSIGAGLLLRKDEIHFFNDIAYYHVPFTHCPTGEDLRLKLKCHCNPADNFDWKGYSCTSRYFDLNNIQKPEGWMDQV
ncbi:alpha 1,2-mannosyltransferase 2.4.1 [Exophiala dermatitidis]|uniref:Alpha 1,2-mannosyltransferase 2.4.1 n=1 Tax=Exophiala dermatitidis TaxID=5970 RepID=A0AAN6IRB7_EXODE|nr:alpha 1,2-mannosyltransferase 2.4.1 [Exophiala dermatitidis]KAJ4517348.1 alpha 1,2-mannosyltransferase 2.4.1 [Exophiala dermatitidis]KAJ4548906.1 alpha 1,2-mannosyltransferase 2.4.1 [Exophiala dermatitidis]KAJ4552374.1 alpha 1,2-mannosyltransferase 2.4.1 [Exophiala dermatitidis]KAJ4568327.1 alpha 1,2-mannosyltransferase 2.4.1 [Exophiala dermatitidis]